MIKYNKIIFVSNSDTCRGQLAASITREIGRGFLEQNFIEIESRGIIVLFPEPMNPKTVAIAASKDLDIDGYVSKALTPQDFGMNTLVLTMTESIKKKVYEDFKEALNVFGLKEFVGEDGDVEAAHGGELVDYGELFRNIERLVNKLIDKLSTMQE